MRADRDRLDSLVAAVADGWPQDWSALDAGAVDEPTRRALQSLQVVARISLFHRGLLEPPRRKSGVRSMPVSFERTTRVREQRAAESPSALGRWGRFELWKKLGEGAYGDVYCAYDTQLDRDVALKLLKRSSSYAEVTRRLLLEARMLAQVRHPNVASVYDVGQHDGQAGLWMELVRGVTLEELIHTRGPMSAGEATLVGQDLCRALAAVHRARLLHRDVKTANVIREVGGRIVLTDLGAGRRQRDGQSYFAGTPRYAAPEVVAGAEATVLSDIYSLGVVLFRLVSGGYPGQAGRFEDRVESRDCGAPLLATPASLRELRPDLPDAFVVVVERALAENPADRPRSAGSMSAALGQVLGVPAPWHARSV